MNNFLGKFSLYEILRIIIPGFYIMIMIDIFVSILFEIDQFNSNSFNSITLFIICAIIIGGFLYSMDIPRCFKKMYSTLPSNLLTENSKDKDDPDRILENEFYKYYYSIDDSKKYKTEIHSGFFHLFINMSFACLCGIVLFSVQFCINNKFNPYIILNFLLFIINMVSAIIIYKQRLKYSWKRNYDEYVEYKKSKMISDKKK